MFSIDVAMLNDIKELYIQVPQNAKVQINVIGDASHQTYKHQIIYYASTIVNDSTFERIDDGVNRDYSKNIIWNFKQVHEINVSGVMIGSILAPSASLRVEGSGSSTNRTIIVNKYVMNSGGGEAHNYPFIFPLGETIKIKGRKIWDDNNSANRPKAIAFDILHDDEIVETISLNAGDDGIWDERELQFESHELLKYQNGQKILYHVVERTPVGYKATINGDQETGYLITNQLQESPTIPSGSLTFSGKKTITGLNQTDKVFIFELYETNERYVCGNQALQTNSTSGLITSQEGQIFQFAPLQYVIQGTHYYVIKEKKPKQLEGFKENTTEYHLQVDVKDEGKNQLLVTVKDEQGHIFCPSKVDFENEYETKQTIVAISKTDKTGKTKIVGAKLQIKDETGHVLDEWISSAKPHVIKGQLTAGKTYLLHEKQAPAGYTYAPDQSFTVNEAGIETEVVMKDEMTSIKVGKYDIENNVALPGCTLQILDAHKQVVKEVTTTSMTQEIEIKGLNVETQYYFKEAIAPQGYAVNHYLIPFVLQKDGSLKVGTINEDQVISEDEDYQQFFENGILKSKDNPTSIKISKVDITTHKELAGAKLQILGQDGNVVKEWTSSTQPKEIIGLETGVTYTLKETVAPAGYALTSQTTITLKDDGTIDEAKTTTKISDEGILLVEDQLLQGIDVDDHLDDKSQNMHQGVDTGDGYHPMYWVVLNLISILGFVLFKQQKKTIK